MSRWGFECTLRDVGDRLRPDYDSLYKAMEYVADHWARVTELNREIASLNAGLTARIEEVRDLKEEVEELKRERPVEVPDDEGCDHGSPACVDCGHNAECNNTNTDDSIPF